MQHAIERIRRIEIFARTATPFSKSNHVAISFQTRYGAESILVSEATRWKFDSSGHVTGARTDFRFYGRAVAIVKRFVLWRNASGYSRLYTFPIFLRALEKNKKNANILTWNYNFFEIKILFQYRDNLKYYPWYDINILSMMLQGLWKNGLTSHLRNHPTSQLLFVSTLLDMKIPVL